LRENRPVRWQPYLWERSRPASPADIERVEAGLGVRFPEDYRRAVMEHQGEAPHPNLFDFVEEGKKTTTVMGPLFHFAEDAGDESLDSYNVLESYRARGNILPEGVIPFSEDPGGNPIAFDFRRSADSPPVVFVNHEAAGGDEGVWTVAASFSELLDKLYSDDDTHPEP
jgi:cell wall assembly regulator SMI1